MLSVAGHRRGSFFPPALALVALLGAALGLDAETLPITAFTTADGLAHDSVRRILHDSRGFLWFSTGGGLSRFDGHRFTTYSLEHGLPNFSVNDVLETSAGVYWVATNGGGVARFDPRRNLTTARQELARRQPGADRAVFEAVSVGDDAASSRVNVIFEDRTGVLWAGTDGGLYRWKTSSGPPAFRFVELGASLEERTLQVWWLTEDDPGDLWIGTSEGVVRRRRDGRTVHHPIEPRQGADHVFALLFDRHGRLWIGHDAGVYAVVPAPFTEVASGRPPWHRLSDCAGGLASRLAFPGKPGDACRLRSAEWGGGVVRALLAPGDESIWIATDSGLVELAGSLRALAAAQGFAETRLQALARDAAGNLWIGTATSGALRWSRSGFVSYGTADGLADPWIGTIEEGAAGELYVVTRSRTLHRYDGERFLPVTPNLSAGLVGRSYPIALLDRGGRWWIPTGEGLYRFPPVPSLEMLADVEPEAVFTTRDGLAGDDVWRLFEDSRGDVWIGTRVPRREILTRWDGATGTFHRYSDADGLPPYNAPKTFCEDRAGNVWIGFWDGGIARHQRGSFTFFSPTDGFPEGAVESLLVDHRGRLWVGTARGGMARLDDPAAEHPGWTTYTPAQGLSSWSALSLAEDRWGRIYVAFGRGVDRLDPETGRVRRYGQADHLAGWPVGDAHRDRAGHLWFGTWNGLSRLVPEPDQPVTQPPVFLTRLLINGAPYPLAELGETEVRDLELAAYENRVQIEFGSLAFAPGQVVRFRHRLAGAEATWSTPSAERAIYYANLAPGHYRFLVEAVTADGLTSGSAASVTFAIRPPLWQRWWFLAAVAGLVGAIAVGLHRGRVRRLLEVERVRSTIATDLHDDLAASLTRMSVLSEVARRQVAATHPEAAEVMAQIGDTSRSLTDATRDLVWAIDPRRDDLGSLVVRLRQFASDLLESEGIAWSLDTTGDLDAVRLVPRHRRHLLLILKEALHNVERHAGADRVAVTLAVSGAKLTARVADDGVGFQVPDAAAPEEDRGGHGLGNMRRRAEELGGTLAIASRPGHGTQVTLEMPLG